jgi:hypothetical protein
MVNSYIIPRLDQELFLSNPFQFIIHQSFYYSCYVLSDAESVENKLQQYKDRKKKERKKKTKK